MAETDDAEETEEVELTEEYQQDLIERLNHLHGGGPVSAIAGKSGAAPLRDFDRPGVLS